MNKFNSYIGNRYTKNGKEVFSWKKFAHIFYLGSAVEWAKSIKEIIDLRKAIIYLLILAGIFIFGYNKGWQNRPVSIDLGYGKEAVIKLNGENLHIDKNGKVFVEDSQGRVIKQITMKDIPGLRQKLAPLGLRLEPFVLAGASAGISGQVGGEAGAGVSFFRLWKMNLDAFLTNRGAYLGSSYKITNNSGIGLGVGKGWRGDDRIIIYYKFKF